MTDQEIQSLFDAYPSLFAAHVAACEAEHRHRLILAKARRLESKADDLRGRCDALLAHFREVTE